MLQSRCHFGCKDRSQQQDDNQISHIVSTPVQDAFKAQYADDNHHTVSQNDVVTMCQQNPKPSSHKSKANQDDISSAITTDSSSVPRVSQQQSADAAELLRNIVQPPALGERCDFCQLEGMFSFPLPEEVYAQNTVSLYAGQQCCITFNVMDALKQIITVNDTTELLEVAYAKEWLESRKGQTDQLPTAKPYDWTYNTLYDGTLEGTWKVEPTDEGIDFRLLSRRDPILFHDHVFLMADDYSDNGMMHMDVRLRVMSTCAFILQRQFIRVDQVIVRLHDTRIFRRTGCDYLIREVSTHEVDIPHLARTTNALPDGRPLHVLCTPNEVSRVLRHFQRTRFERTKLTPTIKS